MSYADVITDDPLIGQPVTALPTPAALVDLATLDANIATMVAFFAEHPAVLRPHAKTHRAPAVARRQLAAGAVGVTCAKVGMAEAMVDGGVGDVFIANQVVAPGAIARLCALGQRARVRVIADDAGNVAQLGAAATAAGITLPVLIEIDAGMGRCGTPPGAPALALATSDRADARPRVRRDPRLRGARRPAPRSGDPSPRDGVDARPGAR